jgi:hypothetical protein
MTIRLGMEKSLNFFYSVGKHKRYCYNIFCVFLHCKKSLTIFPFSHPIQFIILGREGGRDGMRGGKEGGRDGMRGGKGAFWEN